MSVAEMQIIQEKNKQSKEKLNDQCDVRRKCTSGVQAGWPRDFSTFPQNLLVK